MVGQWASSPTVGFGQHDVLGKRLLKACDTIGINMICCTGNLAGSDAALHAEAQCRAEDRRPKDTMLTEDALLEY